MHTFIGTLLWLSTLLITALLTLSPWQDLALADDQGNKCDGIGKQAAQAIIEGTKIAANATPSPLRTPAGVSTQMRIAIVGRTGKLCAEDTTSPDAWLDSRVYPD
jgi:hypothetical protein